MRRASRLDKLAYDMWDRDGLTKMEISKRLGVSRPGLDAMLKRAKRMQDIGSIDFENATTVTMIDDTLAYLQKVVRTPFYAYTPQNQLVHGPDGKPQRDTTANIQAAGLIFKGLEARNKILGLTPPKRTISVVEFAGRLSFDDPAVQRYIEMIPDEEIEASTTELERRLAEARADRSERLAIQPAKHPEPPDDLPELPDPSSGPPSPMPE